MAECHPVGFQWVMEAKARGATIIHVDPRFTRTSAVADMHVPLRAGTDIAFLGGLINHVLRTGTTSASTSSPTPTRRRSCARTSPTPRTSTASSPGFDPESGSYDTETWQYEGAEVAAGGRQARPAVRGPRPAAAATGGAAASSDRAGAESRGSGGARRRVGEPERDETLQHPRCVFQVLKRHFARYTPEMVEQVCGIPQELFRQVAEALTSNSGRERTTAFVYAVGWTQHTVGVQYIRTAAILQALLGNIGRPGGGILALRGHARIQGSTDIPTLFNILPGYIPMPHAHQHETLEDFVQADAGARATGAT